MDHWFVKGAWCVNTIAPLHVLLAVSTRALSIAPANHSESRRYHSWYFSHPWWTALITANSSSPPWPLSSSRESSPILSKSRIIDHASRRKRFGILVHIVQPSILLLAAPFHPCPENEGCFVVPPRTRLSTMQPHPLGRSVILVVSATRMTWSNASVWASKNCLSFSPSSPSDA